MAKNENIERFLATLPAGIKKHAEFMRSLQDGLLYPGVAIREWLEIRSKTDDGRDVGGSKSAWTCVAISTSRQYAGILTAALREYEPTKTKHFEVWSLSSSGGKGPHIIDYEPNLSSEESLHGKHGRHTDITETDVRGFAVAYVIDYYGLHPSNHRFIEILECGKHKDHYANWACRVNFSESGDQVNLLIHPTSRGLEVFAHEYEDPK